MALIDLSGPFKTKNDLLKNIFHKGLPNEVLTLRFFGLAGNNVGGNAYIASTTSGWNHKENKDAKTGQVTEVIKIVESSVITDDIINRATGCDIVYADSSFVRYNFDGKSPKNPMTRQWILTVLPSKGDKKVLPVA